MAAGEETVYRVRAYNTASVSENKIHDDTVAQRLGFGGGLVPGVDVFAYMTHPVVDRWGRDWLERGTLSARFLAPVYDGEVAAVVCKTGSDADVLDLIVKNPSGKACAEGRAEIPGTPAKAPDVSGFPRAPLPEPRPAASLQSLPQDKVLGTVEAHFRIAEAPAYLQEVCESLPIYSAAGVAHPGYLLRGANYVLVANVELGPWIHVASAVRNYGVVTDGERVSVRARVRANYERKGHRFVELDVLLLAADCRPVQSVLHTAIYEPRQLRSP